MVSKVDERASVQSGKAGYPVSVSRFSSFENYPRLRRMEEFERKFLSRKSFRFEYKSVEYNVKYVQT